MLSREAIILRKHPVLGAALAGLAAGCVNGIFGGAGGMVLIPLLRLFTDIEEDALFPVSVGVMLPVCVLSLWIAAGRAPLPWCGAMPWLLGSLVGGVLAGVFGKKIPVLWLHRVFGAMILWGGVRYLC